MHGTVPLLWINLERAKRRRRRMTWALDTGGWKHERINAIDASDLQHRLKARPDLRIRGSRFPGVHRLDETRSFRRTTRPELACLASWQRAIARATEIMHETDTQQVLVLEDDVGASFAVPHSWPVSLAEIIHDIDTRTEETEYPWTTIQLAPISARARKNLHAQWLSSGKKVHTVPKTTIRSHGNGAVLLHRRALPFLDPHTGAFEPDSTTHLMRYPWAVRPVADKWLYACLPAPTVHVAACPLISLDAAESDIHADHVASYHQASRDVTVNLWRQEGLDALIEAQQAWDRIQ